MNGVNGVFFLVMGVLEVLAGIMIIIEPNFYSSYAHRQFDFTGIQWPFGGGLIVLGIFFIRSYFRTKTTETKNKAKDDKNNDTTLS